MIGADTLLLVAVAVAGAGLGALAAEWGYINRVLAEISEMPDERHFSGAQFPIAVSRFRGTRRGARKSRESMPSRAPRRAMSFRTGCCHVAGIARIRPVPGASYWTAAAGIPCDALAGGLEERS